MAYQESSTWGSSYYDSRNYEQKWRATNHAYSQHEQYNPAYPSFNGASNFFSSSSQQDYETAPYHPTKTTGNISIANKPTQKRSRGFKKRKRGGEHFVANQRFHLITIDPNSSEGPKLTKNFVEPAPPTSIKVAPTNIRTANKQRGGRGIQKMPTFRGLQGNGWEPNGHQNQRGAYAAQRGGRGRGGQRGGKFRGPPKPANNKDDIPFVSMSSDEAAIELAVSPENIVAFHGFDSVFTTQHNFPVLIDNRIYTSCDHYYQICKVTDLTGVSSNKLDCAVRDENGKYIVESTDGERDKKAFSAVAKDIIKASNISKEKVDEWRHTKGLEAIQKALHAKLTQSAHLREALKESRDNILVHAFARDSIYGTGCGVPQIKKWLEDLAKAGVNTIKIPAVFPLTETTVLNCPVFAHGRNILGVILMQLREKLHRDEIEVKDMTAIYTALRVNESPAVVTEPTAGFAMDTNTVGTF